ncbi:hypothetical protein NW767_014582 [Fusarium falciforme]|nr:hypothetical protein NW767_014582 [Fusarium falciforme]
MEAKGFPFWTEEGLDFCIQHVLGKTRIRSLIESWFGERCVLVHWIRYRAYPGHTICFRGGGPEAGRRRLMVHLFAKGSEIRYYVRSHLRKLPTQKTEFLFYEIPQPAMVEAGFESEDINNGEVVMFDARLSIELKKGYVIAFLFATEDVVAKWPPMLLPDLPGLAEKVRNEMESDKIGVNFVIDKPTSNARPK